MPPPNRSRMPVSERAKQFAPFAALGGLEEALKKKEDELFMTDRKTLSDEAAERLDRALRRVRAGQTIRLTYYDPEERRYRAVTADVLARDDAFRLLETDHGSIPFDDIRAVSPAPGCAG